MRKIRKPFSSSHTVLNKIIFNVLSRINSTNFYLVLLNSSFQVYLCDLLFRLKQINVSENAYTFLRDGALTKRRNTLTKHKRMGNIWIRNS